MAESTLSPSLSKLTLFILVLLCIFSRVEAGQTQQCSVEDEEFFVTFHPHLDAFWLNTDDQLKNKDFRPAGFLYNMNQRNSKEIFDSMYDALIQNEKRKYFVTEIVFFKDWYEYIPIEKKANVKKMIEKGQLDIVNSGWVQNDEAVCYYDDVLDQYTIGMNWMYEEFGYVNKIAWATDSFGHSHSQVALEHLLGIEFQGIQRIDDRYIYQRKDHPLLEFYWQPVSDSNGRKYGGLLNHVRHFLHEVNDLRRIPTMSVTNDFQNLESSMKKLYGKNKLFRFLGNDFEEFIADEFQNLEHSFDQLNSNGKSEQCTKYKYGNPKDYVHSLKPYWSKNKLQTRQFDFMSNWDQDRYWSGYFTTDPELKIICKRFSRLVNLVRKRMVKLNLGNSSVYQTHKPALIKAEELLSVMQHHDGITATSKSYIEKLFKDRMVNSSKELLTIIQKIEEIQAEEQCRLFENHNTCSITHRQPKITLSILHEGVAKKERLEIVLPKEWAYTVQGIDSHILVSPEGQTSVIFEADIKPGKNDFQLIGQELSQYQGEVAKFKEQDKLDNKEGIKLTLQSNKSIVYEFGQNHMTFSFHQSRNSPSRRQTMAWNKYGQKNGKTETVIPGIYIMSNDGVLKQMNPGFTSMQIAEFGNFYRAFLAGPKIKVTLTFKKDDPSQVDYVMRFSPENAYNTFDYFLKVQSNVVNKDEEFFHDSNGYLVAKRKIGWRPDYEWDYKPQDKINANTYPACSFFYQVNDEEKFIVFLDRAQGISTYDGAMLINIDRTAADDYKGVGEGYNVARENQFNFKLAITSKDDDLERVWQRSYDDSLLAFFSQQAPSKNEANLRATPSNSEQYLKYTVSFLNKDEILIRLHNLAENANLKVSHFGKNSWIIPELSLNLTYKSIRQSFANGLIFKERYNWVGAKDEISHLTRGSEDENDVIVLRPLEIRSWKINLASAIVDKEIGSTGGILLSPQKIAQVQESQKPKIKLPETKSAVKHALRKRCF